MIMALLGISLIVASVVYVIIRPPIWLSPWLFQWKGLLTDDRGAVADSAATKGLSQDDAAKRKREGPANGNLNGKATIRRGDDGNKSPRALSAAQDDRQAMPPPPPPPPPRILSPPAVVEPEEQEEQTTPKAASVEPSLSIPSFSLSADDSPASKDPAKNPTSISAMPPPPLPPFTSSSSPSPSPSNNRRPPTLSQFPAANSIQRARGPVPNRNPAPSTSASGLAPPPTHSSKPSKPSRKVLLPPGHSPLDWARISGPNADLRGVPASTPYMRVPPSLLRQMTGRKGKDAWTALNGKVYNMTPYLLFHPGGVPELMRAAGRDGTKLFGEIHPWVNYETMLAACLVGLLVDEPEASAESEMDKMD